MHGLRLSYQLIDNMCYDSPLISTIASRGWLAAQHGTLKSVYIPI